MRKTKTQKFDAVPQMEKPVHPLEIPTNLQNTYQSIDNRNETFHRLSQQTQQMFDELQLHIQELVLSKDEIMNTLGPKHTRDGGSCASTDDESTRERFLSDDTSDYSTDDDESANERCDDPHSHGYKRNGPHDSFSGQLDRQEQLQAMEEREQQSKERELSSQQQLTRSDTTGTEDDAEKAWHDFDWIRPLDAHIVMPTIVISNEDDDGKDKDARDKADQITFVSEPELMEQSGPVGASYTAEAAATSSTETPSESQQRRRPSRDWSLESPAIHEDFPNRMLVQITGLEFDPPRNIGSPSDTKKKTSIRLVLHSVAHYIKPTSIVEEEFQTIFCFPLDYHSLLFDTLKLDVYEHKSLFSSKRRIGRAFVRLSELTDAFGKTEYEGAFPIASNDNPMLSKTVGTIRLKILFRFPEDSLLEDQENMQRPSILRTRTEPVESTMSNGRKDVIARSIEAAEAASLAVSDVDESEFGGVSVRQYKNTSLGIWDLVLAQETREAIKEITVLYHAFFDHGWRLTKLEFLKAYMLLEKYYLQRTEPENITVLDDIDMLHQAHNFYKYAVASYGSFIFNWIGYGSNAALNAFRLNSDRKAIQEYFKLGKDDIIRWEYGNVTVSKPCFMIVRDPETNTIVVSVRGTMNITDCITDALGHYDPWNGGFVHRGFLRRAQNLVECAIDDIRTAVEKFGSKSICVTGHSLGASVGSIATLILRDRCRDLLERGIELRAYNYAPAPCMSLELARQAEKEKAVVTFVNENDIIPRLSYGNLMNFKELVKFAATELKNEMYKNISGKKKLEAILTTVTSFHESVKSSTERKLYIPGAVYCLQKRTHRSKIKNGRAFYTKLIVCEQSSPEQFAEISLKKKWLFHHFPDRYDRKFKGAIRALRPEGSGGPAFKGFWRWLKLSSSVDDPADLGDDEGGHRMQKWMMRSGHV